MQLLTGRRAAANDTDKEQVLSLAVDECLRLEPSNLLGNRRAVALHHRQRVRTRPHRTGACRRNQQLPLVSASPMCAGMSVARLKGRIAIDRFLPRFPRFELGAPPVRGARARFRRGTEASCPVRSALADQGTDGAASAWLTVIRCIPLAAQKASVPGVAGSSSRSASGASGRWAVSCSRT